MQVDRRDIIQKEYILLDWNVIKYLKEPRDSIDEDAKNLLKTVQQRYEIPFCEAHLRDRARGFSEKNKKRVYEDLDFLQNLSNGVAIGLDEKDKYHLIKGSVYDLFQDIVNEEPRACLIIKSCTKHMFHCPIS